MAIKDVRHYFYTMLAQYVEEKQKLADFEDALKDMIFKECEKLTAVRTQYLKVMTNFIKHNSADIIGVVEKYEKQAIVVRTLRKVYNLIKRS